MQWIISLSISIEIRIFQSCQSLSQLNRHSQYLTTLLKQNAAVSGGLEKKGRYVSMLWF